MHAEWRAPPVTYLSAFPWLLGEICKGSKPLFLFSLPFTPPFPCSLSWLAVSRRTLTLANTLKRRQPHADAGTHTLLKSCGKAEADHIMQIAVARRDVRGIRKETRGEEREREREGGGRWDSGCRFLPPCFSEAPLLLTPSGFLFTPAWPRWQSVWHAVGHRIGQQDKHMAFWIINRHKICTSACSTFNLPPLSSSSLSLLVISYRWRARWHGVLLSEQEPAICLRFGEKLFPLLGEHMSVPKVAATTTDLFTLLLSAFGLFILGHMVGWVCKI